MPEQTPDQAPAAAADRPETVTVVIAFDADPSEHGKLREVTPQRAKLMIREGRARLATEEDQGVVDDAAAPGAPASGEPAPAPATRTGRRAAAAQPDAVPAPSE